MKQLFFLLLVPAALLIVPAAHSQHLELVADSTSSPPDPDRYPRSIYVNMSLGPSTMGDKTGYRNMNRLLENQGIRPLTSNSFYLLGFGARLRRWYVEMQMATTFNIVGEYPANSPVWFDVDTDYFTACINVGYAVMQSRNDVWILRTGLGFSEYFLRVIEIRPGSTLDLSNLSASPSWRVWPAFSHFSAVGNLGIEWQRGGRPKRGISLAPSLFAGYQFGLRQQPWAVSDIPVLNAPTDRAGYAYFGLDFKISRNFERKPKS